MVYYGEYNRKNLTNGNERTGRVKYSIKKIAIGNAMRQVLTASGLDVYGGKVTHHRKQMVQTAGSRGLQLASLYNDKAYSR